METYPIQIDTHVHSVLSGHAWSTLHEDVLQASRVGLRAICLTEHSAAVPAASPEWTPLSMSMIPQYDEGIRIFQGLEADVLDGAGTLCPGDIYLSKSEFCLASMHVVCCESGWDRDTTTEVWTKVCDNPWIDALGHIDRAAYPCDLEAVVRKAIRVGKLIELNNASMIKMRDAGRGNVIQLVHLCMQYGARVCVGSDAHYHTMVGDFSLIQQLLQEVNFPKELIVNRDLATFEAFLAEKQNRTQGRVSNAENYRTRLY